MKKLTKRAKDKIVFIKDGDSYKPDYKIEELNEKQNGTSDKCCNISEMKPEVSVFKMGKVNLSNSRELNANSAIAGVSISIGSGVLTRWSKDDDLRLGNRRIHEIEMVRDDSVNILRFLQVVKYLSLSGTT